MMEKGLFITFEGIDGCGKSTQAKKLCDYIFNLSKYNHVLKTRNPYESRDIRKILREDSNPYSQAEKLAELFVKDRRKHLDELVMPNIEKGVHVVSDRYDCSTLAYQHTQGIPFRKLWNMHDGFLIPDITFIVDVPVRIALERMKKDASRKEIEQKFEDPKNIEFMEKLRENYQSIPLRIDNRKFADISGIPNPDEIFENQVLPEFEKVYNSRYSK